MFTEGFSSYGIALDELGTHIGGLVPAVFKRAVVKGVQVLVSMLTVILFDVVERTLPLKLLISSIPKALPTRNPTISPAVNSWSAVKVTTACTAFVIALICLYSG